MTYNPSNKNDNKRNNKCGENIKRHVRNERFDNAGRYEEADIPQQIWKYFCEFALGRTWGRVLLALCAVVLFITVYALILPAAAISANDASSSEGFYLENGDNAETVFSQVNTVKEANEGAELMATGWEPVPEEPEEVASSEQEQLSTESAGMIVEGLINPEESTQDIPENVSIEEDTAVIEPLHSDHADSSEASESQENADGSYSGEVDAGLYNELADTSDAEENGSNNNVEETTDSPTSEEVNGGNYLDNQSADADENQSETHQTEGFFESPDLESSTGEDGAEGAEAGEGNNLTQENTEINQSEEEGESAEQAESEEILVNEIETEELAEPEENLLEESEELEIPEGVELEDKVKTEEEELEEELEDEEKKKELEEKEKEEKVAEDEKDTDDQEIVYTDGTLTCEADGVSVEISYTANAKVPDSARIRLQKSESSELRVMAEEALTDEDSELISADFYMITLEQPVKGGKEKIVSNNQTADGVSEDNQDVQEKSAGIYDEADDSSTAKYEPLIPNEQVRARIIFSSETAENTRQYAMEIDHEEIKASAEANVIEASFTEQLTVGIAVREDYTYEAGEINYAGNNYTIHMRYDTDARIPKGSRLMAEEVSDEEYEEYLGRTRQALESDSSEVTFARFFDITILFKDREIEPAAKVDVTVSYNSSVEIPEAGDKSAVHFTKNGELETLGVVDNVAVLFGDQSGTRFSDVLEKQAQEHAQKEAAESSYTAQNHDVSSSPEPAEENIIVRGMKTAGSKVRRVSNDIVSLFGFSSVTSTSSAVVEDDTQEMNPEPNNRFFGFTNDSFSVYGTVIVQELRQYIQADGGTYIIKVSYDKTAGIPEDAQLCVAEIADDEEYEQYIASTRDTLDASEDLALGRFFDISIISDGQKIQPDSEVKVSITFIGGLDEADAADSFRTVHFGDNGTEVIDTQILGDETVEAVSFHTGSFSVFGIIGTRVLETSVLTADGETYTITVSFGSEAHIPEDAVLKASEILEGDAEFEEYAKETAKALGISAGSLTHIRMFDISILSGEGEKVQPAAPVQVMIKYQDAALIDEDQTIQVIHFAEKGTEILTPETNLNQEEMIGMADEITFETRSFSIYSIVSSGATADLNGKSFAVINSYTGNALQSVKLNSSKLAAEKVNIVGKYMNANNDITGWSFEEAAGGGYYIRTEDGLYLNITGRNNSGNVTISNSAQRLYVTAGTENHAGMIRITNENGIAINNYSGSTSGGFGTYNDKGDNEWLTLYELESITLNPEYAAEKISVQDIQDAQKIVIYKSVYNDMTGAYEDYVIDGYGNLIKAYDKGDQLVGRSEKTPAWIVTMHRDEVTQELNGYYDYYNEETGMYLSPNSDDTLVSSVRPGVTLNGRRDGEYISTIERWDNDAWAWCGLQIVKDEKGDVMLNGATGNGSQQFSFAALITETTEELHTVRTVDSVAAGITINMFNYPNRQTIANVTGSDGYAVGVLPKQHASTTLTDGYPTFNGGRTSGATLFSPGNSYFQGNGNHLFLESVYNSTGYYEYNAFNNFAHYDKSSGDFAVYQETGTPSNENQFYYKRGNFFPYNNLDISRKATNTNMYDGSGVPLSPMDPTQDGTLYMISNPDFYFGMTVEASFMQAKDGLIQGDPMVYEFNGDDDLWVYVDGVLLLDIGGVHDAWPGSINFATGQITGGNGGAGQATSIRQAFRNAGVFPDGTAWDDTLAEQYFKGDTFIDYGSHNFRMFYTEHGAGASNLEMRFNLPVIEKGKFTVEKVLDGTSQQKFSNVYFAYQAFRKDDTSENSYIPMTGAVYEGTSEPLAFYDSVVINGKMYTDVFYLKPGEAATFPEMADDTEYYVQELGVGTDYYDEIIVNDVKIDGQDATATDGIYPTSVATVGSRARVTYSNHCSEKNLNELRITKQLTEGSVDDGTTFEFRVLLENAEGNLAPYSTGAYYIQNADGDYFHYVNGQLISNGKTPVVASVAGNNGTIAGIPAGYTVVIKDLLAETDFYVEEIRLPLGWSMAEKNVRDDSCDASEMTGTDFAGNVCTADGQIRLDTDADVAFTNEANQKLTVRKQWESGDFVTAHGEIHVALFRKNTDGILVMMDGTLRTIIAPEESVEYLLSRLDGVIAREVTVSDESITPADSGSVITVTGETTKTGENAADSYIVTYVEGEVQNVDENGNTVSPNREDIITNSLPALTINKTDLAGVQLAGAVFRLLKEDGATPVSGYESITSTSEEEGNLLNGIRLSNGMYYLEEISAPSGYNQLENKIRITVENAVITAIEDIQYAPTMYRDETPEDKLLYTYSVQNNPGVSLPSTGGVGTRLFYMLGSILLTCAGILITKRL